MGIKKRLCIECKANEADINSDFCEECRAEILSGITLTELDGLL